MTTIGLVECNEKKRSKNNVCLDLETTGLNLPPPPHKKGRCSQVGEPVQRDSMGETNIQCGQTGEAKFQCGLLGENKEGGNFQSGPKYVRKCG